MKEITISNKNWEILQEISNGKGVDETLSFLFSLLEKDTFPDVIFQPKELKEHMSLEFQSIELEDGACLPFQTGFNPINISQLEVVMELHTGGVIFSNSIPRFDVQKGQSLDWAIKNKTLKNHKKRNIKNVEFNLIKNELINVSSTTEEVDSKSLAIALHLKHADLLELSPSVEMQLNAYYAYEYVITFKNHSYPDYFSKNVTHDHVYKIKLSDWPEPSTFSNSCFDTTQSDTQNYSFIDTKEGRISHRYSESLTFAFLSKFFGITIESSRRDIKILHTTGDFMHVEFEGQTFEIKGRNKKENKALEFALRYNYKHRSGPKSFDVY